MALSGVNCGEKVSNVSKSCQPKGDTVHSAGISTGVFALNAPYEIATRLKTVQFSAILEVRSKSALKCLTFSRLHREVYLKEKPQDGKSLASAAVLMTGGRL